MLIGANTPYEDLDDPSKWGCTPYMAIKGLGSGLSVGVSCLASGLTIGYAGEAAMYGFLHRDVLVVVILLMIFAEAIAIFGFILGVLLLSG